MESEQVNKAVRLVDDVCCRMKELQSRRIGSRTCSELSKDLAAVNRNIRSRDSGKGALLAQKIIWLNHDHLLGELGNAEALLLTAEKILSDQPVRQEIEKEGYSVHKALDKISAGKRLVDNFRNDANNHARLVSMALGGNPVSSETLEKIESRLVQFGLWGEKLSAKGKEAAGRLKKHAASQCNRAAASLALALASALGAQR